MTQQFYKLTLSSAIALYQNGLISATVLVYFYIRIKIKPGWKLTLHQRPTCSELGIQKTAFYKAISRLKKQGLIDWEAPNGLVVSLSQSAETIPQSAETSPQSAETSGQIAENNGQIAENKSSKPASGKDYSPSSDSYQIFIKSLSDSAREKFLNFVNEKIKDFPKPINDVEGWLAGLNKAGQSRWQVYYTMFQSEVGEAVAPSQDWENHPRWKEAIAAMRTGVPRFIVLGQPGCEDIEKSTRQAMADYAEANNLVWGEK